MQEKPAVCFSGREYSHFPVFDPFAFESQIAVPEHDGQQWHPQRQVMILRMCLHNSTQPHPECIESPRTWRTVFREQSPKKPSTIRSHRRRYPCHRCCRLGLRRTQHCHPHLRDRICEPTVSVSNPILASSRRNNLRHVISSSIHKTRPSDSPIETR